MRQRRKQRATRASFARWGRAGGVARAKRMTAMERHDAALRAGLRRWDGVPASVRSQQARAAVLARWRKARAIRLQAAGMTITVSTVVHLHQQKV